MTIPGGRIALKSVPVSLETGRKYCLSPVAVSVVCEIVILLSVIMVILLLWHVVKL